MTKTKEAIFIIGLGVLILGFTIIKVEASKTSFEKEAMELQSQIDELQYTLHRMDAIFILADLIIFCESSGRHDVHGKDGEYGIAQFKEKTFYWMAKKAGVENPDWRNEGQQRWLLIWGIMNGYGRHWTCYDKVLRKLAIKNLIENGG